MGGFGVNLNTSGLGLGAGIDVQGTVAQLTQAAQAGEQVYLQEQQLYTSQTSALNNINSLLSTLQTNVNALQDPLGALAARIVNSSNTNVLTATAAPGTTLGNHTVTVNTLATTSTYNSNSLASGTTSFSSGSFQIQVGSNAPVTVTVTPGSNDTLNTLAAYINSQSDGVTASVINGSNSATLSIVSNTSGQPGDLTVSNNTTGLTFTKTTTGANGSLTIDGVNTAISSNTVSNAVTGITLNLLSTSASQVTLGVTPDTTQATTAINNFVSAYNAVVQAVNTQFTYTSGTTHQAPLFSDVSLQQVQQTLATDINYAPAGVSGIANLASIGVNVQQDGTLKVDSGTLSSSLSGNFSNIQTFFQSTGASKGQAVQFSNDLTSLTDPTRGPLALDLQGISTNQQSVTQTINDFNANLQLQQQTWTQEFSQVNAILQALPATISQVDSQLGSLGSIAGAGFA